MVAPLLFLQLAVAGCGVTAGDGPASGRQTLRVCADPNNLPFSNERGEGLENRVAELLADELDLTLEYQWWPQRRGSYEIRSRLGSVTWYSRLPSGSTR